MGMEVTVTNRTPERVHELVKELQPFLPVTLFTLEWPEAPLTRGWDLIVQTTSVGMDGKSDPFDLYEWTGNEVAYDLIYSPEQTPFLLGAQRSGCTTINGWPMFEGQGQVQSRLFLGD
jgi:3-dehydroquinate dehydratase/shikimate dehydrogenase